MLVFDRGRDPFQTLEELLCELDEELCPKLYRLWQNVLEAGLAELELSAIEIIHFQVLDTLFCVLALEVLVNLSHELGVHLLGEFGQLCEHFPALVLLPKMRHHINQAVLLAAAQLELLGSDMDLLVFSRLFV